MRTRYDQTAPFDLIPASPFQDDESQFLQTNGSRRQIRRDLLAVDGKRVRRC